MNGSLPVLITLKGIQLFYLDGLNILFLQEVPKPKAVLTYR